MSNFPINIVDLLILAVMLVSGFIAFSRGFVREVLSILAWIGALLAGWHGYPVLAPWFVDFLPDPTLAPWASGILIGIISVIALSIVAHHVARGLVVDGLNAVNRSLGFLFGLLRGALLVSVFFLALPWLIDKQDYPDWLRGAKSLPMTQLGAEFLSRLLPDDVQPPQSGATKSPTDGSLREDAEQAARDLIFERLVSPPARSTVPSDDSGYTDKQREDMNRIIENVR